MHPAYSVILFTTASGAGYGLLFWVSLAHAFRLVEPGAGALLTALVLALALITVGLLSSMLHLGHPERAIRALTQWRTSWLSREGVAAIATYMPSGLLGLLWLLGIETGWTVLLAALSAFGAVVTVHCTGMIYASLRTIRQWHLRLVPVVYLALSAASGALLLATVLALFGLTPPWAAVLPLAALIAAAGLKLSYYRTIDGDAGRYTASMALGLGEEGGIRPLDPPHTRPNYVMREMGYQVARRHADRLRRLVMLCLFAAPALLLLFVLAVGWAAPLVYGLAVASTGLGLLIERWLFFAEADHVSMLYYGRQRA